MWKPPGRSNDEILKEIEDMVDRLEVDSSADSFTRDYVVTTGDISEDHDDMSEISSDGFSDEDNLKEVFLRKQRHISRRLSLSLVICSLERTNEGDEDITMDGLDVLNTVPNTVCSRQA
jgi:hypothetical protein